MWLDLQIWSLLIALAFEKKEPQMNSAQLSPNLPTGRAVRDAAGSQAARRVIGRYLFIYNN